MVGHGCYDGHGDHGGHWSWWPDGHIGDHEMSMAIMTILWQW